LRDVVRSRNPSKSTLAHDAVATAVLHKHHPIIRVGAGLIQFAYRSHLRLATEVTRNRNAFSLFSPRVFFFFTIINLCDNVIKTVSLYILHQQDKVPIRIQSKNLAWSLLSDQAHRLLCLKGHVRTCDSTMRQHQLTRSERILVY